MTTARVRSLMRRQIVASLATALSIGACANVDFSYPKAESHAIAPLETAATSLGQSATALASQYPEASGFVLLLDGVDALAARLVAARKAERSAAAPALRWQPCTPRHLSSTTVSCSSVHSTGTLAR
ncbi:MAG: hypothetical protein WD795_04995 [Woeseia sp.]